MCICANVYKEGRWVGTSVQMCKCEQGGEVGGYKCSNCVQMCNVYKEGGRHKCANVHSAQCAVSMCSTCKTASKEGGEVGTSVQGRKSHFLLLSDTAPPPPLT